MHNYECFNNKMITLSLNENNTKIFNQKRSEVVIEISFNIQFTVMAMLLVATKDTLAVTSCVCALTYS